ncbi:hypothetical protein LY78DRAFT_666516 [Colletotrichum sublineola]|nr:hypothetical protein LY78DRAFT_666516 [Colletotrichum sublineola]
MDKASSISTASTDTHDLTFTIALYKAFEVFKTLSANSQVAGQESGNESQVTDAIEEIILASDFSVRDVRTLNGTGSENGLSEDVFTTWNELDVFADFTGRISFETLERIITLWNIQKAEDDFGAAINLLMSDNRVQGSENPFIDLKDVPTKLMLAQMHVFREAVISLRDFTGIITSLAMQKPATYVTEAFYHTKSLVYIVDAFTVSHGWPMDIY